MFLLVVTEKLSRKGLRDGISYKDNSNQMLAEKNQVCGGISLGVGRKENSAEKVENGEASVSKDNSDQVLVDLRVKYIALGLGSSSSNEGSRKRRKLLKNKSELGDVVFDLVMMESDVGDEAVARKVKERSMKGKKTRGQN